MKVQKVFDYVEQRYGAEKIRVILAENGVTESKKKVLSIMRELDLKSIRCNTKKNYDKQQILS